EICCILSHVSGGGAETRCIVDRLLPDEIASHGHSALKSATNLDSPGMDDGVAIRRFPRERLNAIKAESGGCSVRSFQNVETRSLNASVVHRHHEPFRELALHAEIPGLRVADAVVLLDSEVICHRCR